MFILQTILEVREGRSFRECKNSETIPYISYIYKQNSTTPKNFTSELVKLIPFFNPNRDIYRFYNLKRIIKKNMFEGKIMDLSMDDLNCFSEMLNSIKCDIELYDCSENCMNRPIVGNIFNVNCNTCNLPYNVEKYCMKCEQACIYSNDETNSYCETCNSQYNLIKRCPNFWMYN